jgi:hypothetical protein
LMKARFDWWYKKPGVIPLTTFPRVLADRTLWNLVGESKHTGHRIRWVGQELADFPTDQNLMTVLAEGGCWLLCMAGCRHGGIADVAA